jgi:hypothetical protein
MLKKTWTVLAGLLIVAAVMLGTSGCRQVENAIDCHGICNRYKDCFDHNYDDDACEDRCEDAANDNKDYMRKADACNDCLGDKSCASATFNCIDECAGIVP